MKNGRKEFKRLIYKKFFKFIKKQEKKKKIKLNFLALKSILKKNC